MRTHAIALYLAASMISLLNRVTHGFTRLPANADPEVLRKHHLFVLVNLIVALFALLYGVMSYFIAFAVGMYAMAVSIVFFLSLPWLLRSGVRLQTLGVAFGVYVTLLNAVLVFYSGGLFVSPVTPFVVLTAPLSLMFCSVRVAVVFAVLSVLYVVLFSVAKNMGVHFPFTYRESFHNVFLALALSGLVFILLLVTNTFENTKNTALGRLMAKQQELAHEQERSDRLLRNILPEATVAELKESGSASPQRYHSVTVMFADFVSFSKVSEQLSAAELVKIIDLYFRKFDDITDKHRIEKIKTIGDSYMCVAGLPQESPDHALRMVHAALEFLNCIEQMKNERHASGLPYFDIRIGINTGPVVAGVVGHRKFAYDIWGDTVNTAARMQQHSEPGHINISGSTYELVKDACTCRHRGRVAAKNKGEIDMYFVELA